MNFDYDIELDARNHIIAHIEGKRCLIDTGCPVTMGEGTIRFGAASKTGVGAKDEVLAEKGWSLENINKLLGYEVDALIGTDLLATARWFVDPFQKTLTVGFLPKGKVEVINGRYNGSSPVVTAEVNGDECEMLLDTGANVNFISRRYSEEWPIHGEHEDFYPTIGKFKTPLRRANFKLFGYQFGPIKFADLPNELDMVMQLGTQFGAPKMHGIAGMEILNHGSLGFDLRSGVVVFVPHE